MQCWSECLLFSKHCHFINVEWLRLKRVRRWGQVWILLLFLISPGPYKNVWYESLCGIPFKHLPELWNLNQSSGLWFSLKTYKITLVFPSLGGLLYGRGALSLQWMVPRRQPTSVLSPNPSGPAACGAGLDLMEGWTSQLHATQQNGFWERWIAPYFGQNYRQKERKKKLTSHLHQLKCAQLKRWTYSLDVLKDALERELYLSHGNDALLCLESNFCNVRFCGFNLAPFVDEIKQCNKDGLLHGANSLPFRLRSSHCRW